MIAICGFFYGRGVILMVPMGAMGPFWPGDGSFWAWAWEGRWLVGFVQSRDLSARISPSEGYPVGKLQ